MGNWPTEPVATNPVTYYLTYYVWYSDLAAFDTAVAAMGGDSILRSPQYISNALGIAQNAPPWVPGFESGSPWIDFNRGSGATPVGRNFDGTWAPPLTNAQARIYGFPATETLGDTAFDWPNSSYTLDWTQDWVIWPSKPASSGSAPGWPASRPVIWIWQCNLRCTKGSVSSTPTTITPAPGEPTVVRVPIRPRRFATGFETQNGGQLAPDESPEGLAGIVQSEGYTRAASRTPDGIGYLSTDTGLSCRMLLTDSGTPSNTRHSAERIYVKFQKYPTTATRFLKFSASSANGSMNITIDQNGALNAFTINNFLINSGPLGAGGTLALNTWYRIDSYIVFTATGTGCDATYTLSIKGGISLSVTGTVDTGFGPANLTHASTTIESGGNGLEVMYDDWENIDPGSSIGTNLQTGTIDYWTGVHMQLIRNTGFNENTDWSGEYLASMQKQTAAPLATITSSISEARLSLVSDMAGISFTDRLSFVRQQGTIALIVLAAVSKGASSTTDEIGFIHALGEETAVKSMGTALNGYHHLFNVSDGLDDPIPVDELEPCYPLLIKSADTNVTNVSFLALEAIFMGQYGPEDQFLTGEFIVSPELIGYHNAPFWVSFLGRSTTPPPNSVMIETGTYVGNGTSQEIELEMLAAHWIMIRNTATNQKTWWWSTHLGPHLEVVDESIRPGLLVDVDLNDDLNRTVLKLVNNNNASNANGVTYQYVAFSDPMSRVLMNIPFRQTTTSPVDTPLFDTGFTPEFGMIQAEGVKNASSSIRMYTKGPGMTANQAKNSTNVSPTSTGMTFGTGEVTELAEIIGAGYTRSMALWRQYPDNDNTKFPVACLSQYTGNGGVGNRTIAVTLNGRRPIFCMVIPLNNNEPFLRDPSHSSGNSTQVGSTTTINTAITGGGVDSIIVGTSLNQNGVVYSVFILPSCTDAAGNDGWGVDGFCALAEPSDDNPPSWYEAPPDPPADIAILGSGGLVISGNPAILALQNASGIYKLVPGQHHDHLQDVQTGQTEVDVPIPNPYGKTGFVGG